MKPYYTIEEMLDMLPEPDKSSCKKLYFDSLDLLKSMPGSSHNHQAWPGGCHDHFEEIMNLYIVIHVAIEETGRKLPFPLTSGIKVCYLHDFEKPFKNLFNLETKEAKAAFRLNKLKEYGICLTVDEENALKYVEGENKDYTNKARMMGRLAALCHCADILSARAFFDYPRPNDPWSQGWGKR